MNDSDTGFFGSGKESIGLSGSEGGRHSQNGIGNRSTKEIGSVGEEDSKESDNAVVNGEGSGLLVDGDGECRLSVRFDDRSGVARLLDVLYFVVSNRVGFSSAPVSCSNKDRMIDIRFAEQVSESQNGVLSVSNELSASGNTRVLKVKSTKRSATNLRNGCMGMYVRPRYR